MSTISKPRSDPQRQPRGPQPTVSIVTSLAEDMRKRWLNDERPCVEEYCARHPELLADPDAALGLIFEELSLREAAGDPVRLSELVGRFPQWEERVRRLFDCQALLGVEFAEAPLPECGETLGEFRLLAELGRGRQGRVFLATEPLLANRTLVLKVTPMQGCEHLSLARLQHTHIVPLYFVKDLAWRQIRVLGMPYFGGSSLDRLLDRVRDKPLAARTGADVIQWLQDEAREVPPEFGNCGATLSRLSELRYDEVVCWIGVALADALQSAHEKGLVHLDLKPSNVLMTADGQPMLLDFHLARDPIRAGAAGSLWLGGTRAYMSPEQAAAFDAISQGEEVVEDVDERSDLYALGLLLYELLGGDAVGPSNREQGLLAIAQETSIGLTDIIAKCLASRTTRYRQAAHVATDLRRHLAHRPLVGVPNRSWRERWQKWRLRHPQAVRNGVLLAGILGTLGLAAGLAWQSLQHQRAEAGGLLAEARQRLLDGHIDLARRSAQQGLQVAQQTAGGQALVAEFQHELLRVRSAQLADDLHRLVVVLKDLYGLEPLPGREAAGIVAQCDRVWAKRDELFDQIGAQLPTVDRATLRHDLLELVLLWSDLRLRTADPEERNTLRDRLLEILNQAESISGKSIVLDYQRSKLLAPGLPAKTILEPLRSELLAATPWESYALGLCLLNDGQLEPARRHLARAVALQPDSLWSQFYYGRCLYQLRDFAEATRAFSACIALGPGNAGAYYNRGIVFQALGDAARAADDFARARDLDPTLNVPPSKQST